MPDSIEMPRYKCHKEVWALKIVKIEPATGNRPSEPQEETDGGSIITPENPRYEPFKVEAEYVSKHNPQVGGYYVVYEDGYKSFSPAQAFEEGYTLME